MNFANVSCVTPGELAQNIGQLSHLNRQEQLDHLQEHIGRFQNVLVEFLGNNVANTPTNQIRFAVTQAEHHHDEAIATQHRPGTSFDYQVFHALQHLNHAQTQFSAAHSEGSMDREGEGVQGSNHGRREQKDDSTHGSDFSEHSSLTSPEFGEAQMASGRINPEARRVGAEASSSSSGSSSRKSSLTDEN